MLKDKLLMKRNMEGPLAYSALINWKCFTTREKREVFPPLYVDAKVDYNQDISCLHFARLHLLSAIHERTF